MDPRVRIGAGVAAIVLLILARVFTRRRHRFFTYETEREVSEAVGPACVWRPTHKPPAAAAVLALWEADRTGSHRLWITGLVLVLVAGFGLPITTRPVCCSGPIERGHKRSAANNGTTGWWNYANECRAHNRTKSSRNSWTWAFAQFLPWTIVVYAWRDLTGLIRVAAHRIGTR